MEKVLSQDEVDALLRGISNEDVEVQAETEELEGSVRSYDLTSQDRIIRGRMPTLEAINDRFARLHRVTLSAVLRRVVDVTAVQTDMTKFGEFIRTLPVPTSLNIVKMDPLRGLMLLVVESRLIFSLVDCLFGGTGKSRFKVEGRDFTSIEQKVISRIVSAVLADLDNAWSPVIPVNFQLTRSELNPQFATIVAPTDLVVVVHFELELEQLIGKIILCLPYSTLEPIRSRLNASYQSDQLEVDDELLQRLRKRMLDIDVEILVEFGKSHIKGRDLLDLNIGDVLLLDKDVGDLLTVKVQGVPKFKAKPGTSRGNQAVQVVEAMAPPVFESAAMKVFES